jgi:hypothetical protein
VLSLIAGSTDIIFLGPNGLFTAHIIGSYRAGRSRINGDPAILSYVLSVPCVRARTAAESIVRKLTRADGSSDILAAAAAGAAVMITFPSSP